MQLLFELNHPPVRRLALLGGWQAIVFRYSSDLVVLPARLVKPAKIAVILRSSDGTGAKHRLGHVQAFLVC